MYMQFLEVIKLENNGLTQEDAMLSRDMFLLQVSYSNDLAVWILLTLIQNTEMLRCVVLMLQKYMRIYVL